DIDALTIADVRSVAGVLAARGWTWPKALRSLQTPERNALRALHDKLPQGADNGDANDAILLTVPVWALPTPLPTNWVVARRTGTRVTLLVFTTSWLDWREFRVCSMDPSTHTEVCHDTGRVPSASEGIQDNPAQVAGLPAPPVGPPELLRVRVRIAPPTQSGLTFQRISMRTLRRACHGRIAELVQPTSR